MPVNCAEHLGLNFLQGAGDPRACGEFVSASAKLGTDGAYINFWILGAEADPNEALRDFLKKCGDDYSLD